MLISLATLLLVSYISNFLFKSGFSDPIYEIIHNFAIGREKIAASFIKQKSEYGSDEINEKFKNDKNASPLEAIKDEVNKVFEHHEKTTGTSGQTENPSTL